MPRPASQLRVAVVIADEIHRCGLTAMLRGLDVVIDVAEYATAAEFPISSTVDKMAAHVLVCRAGEADRALIDAAREAGMNVLVLLDHTHPGQVAWAAGVPAHGFLRQHGLTARQLGDMLVRLVDDQVFMPQELARELFARTGYLAAAPAGESAPGRRSRSTELTPREMQALSLLAHGLVNKQIARHLRISEHGAKRLVGNVLTKLSCSNRTLAVATALREGLIRPNGTVAVDGA
jgi:DNA-binding NarL/FixJ family response regulator